MTLRDRFGKLALRGVAVSVAVIGFAFGPTALPAAAATEMVGAHAPAEVDCNLLVGNGMLVHFPEMWAVPVYRPGVAVIGPSHVQWVASQATLLKWDAGRSVWAATSRGRWISTQVPDNANNSIGANSYYEFDGSRWVPAASGATAFRNLPGGFYKVSVSYHWYEDALVTQPGSDVLVSPNYTISQAFSLSQQPYCSY
jgi:hypothetical protein